MRKREELAHNLVGTLTIIAMCILFAAGGSVFLETEITIYHIIALGSGVCMLFTALVISFFGEEDTKNEHTLRKRR